MWTQLDHNSASLVDVFQPLQSRAAQFDRAWSIAELELAEQDVEWLLSWFRNLPLEGIASWIRTPGSAKQEDDRLVPHQQMLGSLLVCAGAEACRRVGCEGSVWPVVRSILPELNGLQHDLFLSDGQPSSLTRDAIADAVRALNLRNVMDIEGTQQWFLTIKMQFGFTLRGARNSLAKWLVDLGQPHAVQYLLGNSEVEELSSESFHSLWRTLKQYRCGLIQAPEVKDTLLRSPWVKSDWIDDLLKEAKAKLASLGTGEWQPAELGTYEEEALGEETCPIAGVALEWPPDKSPRLNFSLDRKAIEDVLEVADAPEADFYVDGTRLCRWLRQQDGSWAGADSIHGELDKNVGFPNLAPRTLAIRSSSGELLMEWDLADSGLSEDVLVFDVDRERMINAGAERLKSNRNYAIICDRGCKIHGCSPVEVFERNGILRKVLRLAPPLTEHVRISYDEFVLWQPVTSEEDEAPRFPLTLTTPKAKILSLQSKSQLCLEGLPEDAKSVALLIHKNTYDMQRADGGWQTAGEVVITPKFAARQRRVLVRFSSGDKKYSIRPRLALNLLGVAMLRLRRQDGIEDVSFETLDRASTLNRSEGTAYVRIWTPAHGKPVSVWEGGYKVGNLRHGKVRLRDLPGNGGEIHAASDCEDYSLGVASFDTGCVHDYLDPMLNCDAQLFMLSDKNPGEAKSDGYTLYSWSVGRKGKARLDALADTQILPSSRDRVWKLKGVSNPIAIALTRRGSWLGAWWSLEKIREYVDSREDLSERDFAILKWLRVPVLHPAVSPAICKAVLRSPGRFTRTWLSNRGLPDTLCAQGHIFGLDSLVRAYLWNDFPPSHARDAIADAKELDGGRPHKMSEWSDILNRLSRISPVLLWKGMEQICLSNREEMVDVLRLFTRSNLGLPFGADLNQMQPRLHCQLQRAASATGMSLDRLADVTTKRLESLHEKRWRPLDENRGALQKLGETFSGRTYLAVKMGLYWLDLGNS